MTEIGKAVASTVDALKSAPVVLGLFLINLIFIGGTLYTVTKTNDRHERQLAALIERCLPDHRVK